ncbi:MAG TPA: hypothetical protein VLX92_29880 [Kofleriaceae bacterium]|nr:hypothetical protein [Kofleriaceae bacterium]
MIAHALALACDDPAVLARLGGPLGAEARAAARELAALPRGDRARLAAIARAPVPQGLRGAHGSWIEAALAELPARARAAVAAGGGDAVDGGGLSAGGSGAEGRRGSVDGGGLSAAGSGAEGRRGSIDTWLARWACAAIPPLPPVRDRAPRSLDDVVALPGDRLLAWLGAVGRAQRAYAISLAAPGAVRRDELGAARAVIARCRPEGSSDLAIGARAIAPHVAASPIAARQLAVRLPRELGLAIEAELLAHASDPIEHAPRWTALG